LGDLLLVVIIQHKVVVVRPNYKDSQFDMSIDLYVVALPHASWRSPFHAKNIEFLVPQDSQHSILVGGGSI
jgi:hypothetical protein